jgi:DNA-directed RNA polymerase subunit RPC12/RpoP
MTLKTKPAKRWVCVKCGARNELRGSSRKCPACLSPVGRRPKRTPRHARIHARTSYERYADLSVTIHGGEPMTCGVCGAPPKTKKLDRDHDHRTGNPRGLACFRCNHELLRNATLEQARAVVAYLERVEVFYAQ